ncbi:MAG TPA: S-layer homology domain-containing protein [Symbiobacteriaceae bacterium]|nr:S-layer homology domain-containing protein [Symbiobacteriaceae bacterium]
MCKPRVVLSLFLALSLLLPTGAAAAQHPWKWANPLPTGAELNGIIYGDGQFVAVGTGATIISSPDGTTWTARSAGTDITLQGVTYGNGRYVAVGGNSTAPGQWVIATSTDGMDWQPVASGSGYTLGAIAYGGDRFVAVGSQLAACGEAGGIVLTSVDGLSWEEETWDGAPPLLSVAYGGGRFVAVGPCDPTIVTSADGAAWTTTYDMPSGIWNRRAVAYGGGRFISAAQFGPTLQSADGLHWTEQAPPQYTQVIRYAGGRFISSVGASLDGVNWTPPDTQSLPMGFALHDVVFGGNTYVAVGANLLATSTDGLTWTSQRTGLMGAWHGIAAGEGRYVAVGVNGWVAGSADGHSWKQVYAPEPPSGVPGFAIPNLLAVAYGSGTFVAVGSPRFLVLTSADGVSWSASHQWESDGSQGYSELTDVTFGGGRFVAVGSIPNGQSESIASSDGIRWSHSAAFTDATLSGVAYDGSRFVAVGHTDGGQKGGVWTSPDGIAWTPVTVDLPPLRSVAYGLGRFVAFGNVPEGDSISSCAFVSLDGRTWERVPLPGPLHSTRISVAGGFFVFHGWSALYVSQDGLHWGEMPMPAATDQIADIGDQMVAVGPSGAILTLSPCGGFIDVSADDSACQAVRVLQDTQVIGGYPDGTFRPDAPVTRAELAKLLSAAFGEAPAPAGLLPFTDTAGNWAATQGYLQAAVALNAVSGYPDGTFRPDSPVTRAELIKMVAAASSLQPGSDGGYSDVAASDWYAAAVSAAAAEGLIGAGAPTPLWSGPELRPNHHATRSETAILLANLLERMRDLVLLPWCSRLLGAPVSP